MKLFKPLASPPVAWLWAGLAVSAVGNELFSVALAWLAAATSGADASWLSALRGGVSLTVALLGGMWAERWDHRSTMLGSHLGRAAIALLPILAWYAGMLTLWVLGVIVILLAAISTFSEPALRASIPRLVRKSDDLQATNALFDAVVRIARVVGPMLAGAITLITPVEHLFFLSVVAFLFAAWTVGRLVAALPKRDHATPTSRRAALTAGWVSLAGRYRMQALYLCAVLGNVAWVIGIANGIALAVVKYDISGWGLHGLPVYSAIMGAYGIGNLIAIVLIGNAIITRLYGGFAFGSVLNGLGIALVGLSIWLLPSHWVMAGMMLGAALAALGGPLIDLTFIILIQTTFPQEMIASMVRLRIAALGASVLIAGVVGAYLYARLDTETVIIYCGALEALAGFAVLLFPLGREMNGARMLVPTAR